MFRFIKKMFIAAMMFVGCGTLKYVSMSGQECKIRPVIMNINSNESLFHLYSVLVNKCGGSCNATVSLLKMNFFTHIFKDFS